MIEVQKNKVVLITYVWPEPLSSAAGLRELNLIDSVLWAGWDLVVASSSQQSSQSAALGERGVRTAEIRANDSAFDAWIKSEAPDLVIFDRFLVEEQFGWRVQEQCPDALRVLDTIDLHFLRRTRSRLIEDGKSLEEIQRGSLDFNNDDTFREIASIYRCDGVFVVSSFEHELLSQRFHVPQGALSLSRFHYPDPQPNPGFHSRSDFMMIGNFRHLPNQDGVIWLSKEIWPRIRRKMPNATLNIYGAYPSREVMRLTSEKTGFFVRGPAVDQFETLRKHRVNLAPLRFGAGIKGKISDGWWCGTPVVSTSMGAEGMHDAYPFGGIIADSPEAFADAAVRLAEDEDEWMMQQERGYFLAKALYHQEKNRPELIGFLKFLLSERVALRSENWIGSMLRFHALRSTRYFSKWIEEKSKGLGNNESLNRR